ncbi:MAG TPA: cyclase family protein [Kineosporiaceae bacterium]|nr:cyclase family protein [Kineosporiaceae bacterium]
MTDQLLPPRSDEFRACFDADLAFTNGGSLAVRDFRLDVPSPDLGPGDVGLLLVAHLGLLMVGEVRVSGLRFVAERHKGSRGTVAAQGGEARRGSGVRLVDLTHPVEEGMTTYPGLPGPTLGIHLSREDSMAHYAPGTTFEMATITMVGNTGTYLDAPWHRFVDGTDLAGLPLDRMAALPGLVVDVTGSNRRGVDVAELAALDVEGRAVLLHTGWDRHWRTPAYGAGAPFLTGAAARSLVERGAVLVGIDSVNIDDASPDAGGERPAHTALLGAGIPVLEHLTGLAALPTEGFALHAAPVPVRRFGTFPVRAYAVIPE